MIKKMAITLIGIVVYTILALVYEKYLAFLTPVFCILLYKWDQRDRVPTPLR